MNYDCLMIIHQCILSFFAKIIGTYKSVLTRDHSSPPFADPDAVAGVRQEPPEHLDGAADDGARGGRLPAHQGRQRHGGRRRPRPRHVLLGGGVDEGLPRRPRLLAPRLKWSVAVIVSVGDFSLRLILVSALSAVTATVLHDAVMTPADGERGFWKS